MKRHGATWFLTYLSCGAACEYEIHSHHGHGIGSRTAFLGFSNHPHARLIRWNRDGHVEDRIALLPVSGFYFTLASPS